MGQWPPTSSPPAADRVQTCKGGDSRAREGRGGGRACDPLDLDLVISSREGECWPARRSGVSYPTTLNPLDFVPCRGACGPWCRAGERAVPGAVERWISQALHRDICPSHQASPTHRDLRSQDNCLPQRALLPLDVEPSTTSGLGSRGQLLMQLQCRERQGG